MMSFKSFPHWWGKSARDRRRRLPAGFAPGADNSSDWVFLRAFKWLSGLVVWVLLLLAGGGLATGYLPVRGCDKSAAEPGVDVGGPIRKDIVRYTSKFVIAVKNANRQRRDMLADYATFCSVWSEVSPNEPMMFKMVSPATRDPRSKKVLPALNGPTIDVNAKNFAEILPLFDEISTLILEGDGTGRGRLQFSGYEAEPAELELGRAAGALIGHP